MSKSKVPLSEVFKYYALFTRGYKQTKYHFTWASSSKKEIMNDARYYHRTSYDVIVIEIGSGDQIFSRTKGQ